MMSKYQAYPEYKDSGVKWLENIPAHWVIYPSKRLFPESKKRADLKDQQLSATQDYGVISQERFMQLAGRRVVQLNSNQELRKHVEVDDFVISMRSFQGGLERAWEAGGIRSSYVVLKPTVQIKHGYFQYLFKSSRYIQAIQSTANFIRDGQDMNYQNFVLIDLPYPQREEQTKIAAFLDHETAKIDTLIEKQLQLIKLLKEKRQAVISHAVTKGLNPDAPMKDSGVEWLGEVPEHWFITKIKYLAEITPPKSQLKYNNSDQCTFLPMEKLKTNSIVKDEKCLISDVIAGYTYFENGDILMAKVTPCFENKNIAIANDLENGIGFGSSEIYVLRPNEKIVTEFLFFRLQEDNFMAAATGAMTGAGGLKRVPSDFIANYSMALPPKDEIPEIVSHIQIQQEHYDKLERQAHSGIQLLQERRTALISAAVTGKIDVRNWVAPTTNSDTNEAQQEVTA